MSRFADKAKAIQAKSPVMEGREKLVIEDVIRIYPEGVTVNRFDILHTREKDGTTKDYVAFNIAEDDKVFVNGGKGMLDIAMAWVEDFDGDITGAAEALYAEGGVKIKFTKTKTKSGNNFIRPDVIG